MSSCQTGAERGRSARIVLHIRGLMGLCHQPVLVVIVSRIGLLAGLQLALEKERGNVKGRTRSLIKSNKRCVGGVGGADDRHTRENIVNQLLSYFFLSGEFIRSL